MDYQFWSLLLGLISILCSQAEQSLRCWLDSFKAERPVYRGNWLPLVGKLSEKLKAHKKTMENVIPCLSFLRWAAIIFAIISLIFDAKK